MPWLAFIPAAAGLAQTIIAGSQAKKSREALEKSQVPTAKPDQSVSRYYNEAFRRYNVAPTSSAQYKYSMANANRNLSEGLAALKDRRSLIGGVSGLVGRTNDAALKAGAVAEQDQANRFGVLGNASARKTADDRYLFNQNEMMPYNKFTTLAGMKAQANAATFNTGLQNIYSGLSNYAAMRNGTYTDPNTAYSGYGTAAPIVSYSNTIPH